MSIRITIICLNLTLMSWTHKFILNIFIFMIYINYLMKYKPYENKSIYNIDLKAHIILLVLV